jgi:hypothetical protein
MCEDSKKTKWATWPVVIIAVTVVIFLWGVVFIVGFSNWDIPFISLPQNIAQRGQFGDMLNVATSLVTSLALAFIILGFLQQREEVKISKADVKLTRKQFDQQMEMNAKQEVLIKEQTENLRKQSNDDAAMKLISLFAETKKNLVGTDFSKLVEGFHESFWQQLWADQLSNLANGTGHSLIKELFKIYFYSDHPNPAKEIPDIKNGYKGIESAPNVVDTLLQLIPKNKLFDTIDFFSKYTHDNIRNEYLNTIFTKMDDYTRLKLYQHSFDRFFLSFGHQTGPYFRLLFNIANAISNLEDNTYYMNLLRALFSKHDLEVFFYNLLSTNGSAKFVVCVENFDLLKGIECEGIVPMDFHSKDTVRLLLNMRKAQKDTDYSIHKKGPVSDDKI